MSGGVGPEREPYYDRQRNEWVPRCPHGHICSGCDAAGSCPLGVGPERPERSSPVVPTEREALQSTVRSFIYGQWGHAGDEQVRPALAALDGLLAELEAAEKNEREIKDWLAEHALDHEEDPADYTTLQLAESLFAWGDRAWGVAGSVAERLEAAEKALRDTADEIETLERHGRLRGFEHLIMVGRRARALAGSAARTEET